MNKYFANSMVTFIILFASCSYARVVYYERDQLNYPLMAIRTNTKQLIPPPKPESPNLVKAEIAKVIKYEGGMTSFDTWPHYRLTLHIIKGKLPEHPSTEVFYYHTADLFGKFIVGNELTFIFDKAGRLYRLEKISPEIHDRKKHSESYIIQPAFAAEREDHAPR